MGQHFCTTREPHKAAPLSHGGHKVRLATVRMTRLGDCLIACILLAITCPLMIIVALVIKMESAGPVLDRQSCIGRGGRHYRMLQFRIAVHDPSYAMPPWARKPTALGRFLWRYRMDALPQLINVFRGELSIRDWNQNQ
jgi:lipopolysaccharide/colanic/teichoic acid biosynthesis glycosyltransferase